MTKQVQRRRGTATQHTSFTGAEGEISVNTTNKSVHVHDGVTAGGVEAARADLSNVSEADVSAALAGATDVDINGGSIDGTVIGANSAAAITGTTITGTSFVTSGNMTFGDNDKAIFGAGSDLQIYHDGTDNYIDAAGAGDLILQAQTPNEDIRLKSDDGLGGLVDYITVDGSIGQVKLRFYGDVKLNTTNTGVDITSDVTLTGATDTFVYFKDPGAVRSNYIGMTGSDNIVIAADDNNQGTDSFIKLKVDGGDVAYLDGDGRLILNDTTPSGIGATFGSLFVGGDTPSTRNAIVFGESQAASESNRPVIMQTSSNGIAQDLSIVAHSSTGKIRFWVGSSASSNPFSGGNTNRVTIDEDGNVLINTTDEVITDTSGAGAVLSSSSANFSHQFKRETPNANSSVMVINDTGAGGEVVDFRRNGVTFGQIGTDTTGGNSFRIKDNGGTDRINIFSGGQIVFNGEDQVSSTFVFKVSDSGTSNAPDMRIYRDSSTPADGDGLGSVQYAGNASNLSEQTFVNLRAAVVDVTSGTEDSLFYATSLRNGVEKIDYFTRGGRMGLSARNAAAFTPATHTFDPSALLELRSGTTDDNRIYFNDSTGIRNNWIGLDGEADNFAISVDSAEAGTDSRFRLRVDNFSYMIAGDTDNSIEFNMKNGGWRVQRAATSNLPVLFKTTSDSGEDFRIQIGGARTAGTTDTAVISLRNFADQSTGGDYTMADLVGMDPVADASQKKGSFIVRTRSGTSMQAGLLVDEKQRVILARRGGSGVYNGLPANVDSTTRCFIDQQDTGSAYHTLWVASDGGTGDPAITVSGPGSAYTPSCKIFGDGDIENTNNSYGTLASERRFKQDIVDATPQWDDIKALSWKKFRLKDDVAKLGDDAPVQLGLIIDELEQVSPNLVNSKEVYANRENPLLDENGVQKTDEDGNLLTEQERYLADTVKGYKTSVIFMKGMIALQEAMERIEQLEAEVAALKAQ